MDEREAIIQQVIATDNRPRHVAEELVRWWLDDDLDVHCAWPSAIHLAVDAYHGRRYYADDRRVITRADQDRVAREYRARCAEEDAR